MAVIWNDDNTNTETIWVVNRVEFLDFLIPLYNLGAGWVKCLSESFKFRHINILSELQEESNKKRKEQQQNKA